MVFGIDVGRDSTCWSRFVCLLGGGGSALDARLVEESIFCTGCIWVLLVLNSCTTGPQQPGKTMGLKILAGGLTG